MIRPAGSLIVAALLTGLATPAPVAGQREAPAALISAARAVGGQVAGIRELPWQTAVSFQVSDRATIRRYARAALERDMSPPEWRAYQALLSHCGLIPVGLDLKELAVRLYTEQVAGYYDPQAKTFYLADWLPRFLQRAVVAHEATHALQDQHFDLVRWLEAVPPNEDGAMARAAVVEGDAMAAMLAYFLVPAGGSLAEIPDVGALLEGGSARAAQGFPTFEQAPPALQRLLLFPYIDGMEFVLAAFREGGWDAVDSLYADPPQSTEQVLHPERYWGARDEPREPATPAGPGDGRPLIEGSWGELGTGLILAAALGDSVATATARGWDGDRYALYPGPAGRTALAWTVVWDSPARAERFAGAYAQAAAARFPGPARLVTGQGRFRLEGEDRVVEVEWTGDKVEIRENFP